MHESQTDRYVHGPQVSKSGLDHQFNSNVEVHYFQLVVQGSLSYDGSYAHCEGSDAMVDGKRIASLLTTESLKFTIREVTV